MIVIGSHGRKQPAFKRASTGKTCYHFSKRPQAYDVASCSYFVLGSNAIAFFLFLFPLSLSLSLEHIGKAKPNGNHCEKRKKKNFQTQHFFPSSYPIHSRLQPTEVLPQLPHLKLPLICFLIYLFHPVGQWYVTCSSVSLHAYCRRKVDPAYSPGFETAFIHPELCVGGQILPVYSNTRGKISQRTLFPQQPRTLCFHSPLTLSNG